MPAELNVKSLKFSFKTAKPKLPENLLRPQVEVKETKIQTPKAGDKRKASQSRPLRDPDTGKLYTPE